MFQKQNKKSKVKLYVRRVFITDDVEDLMPDYLQFISGIVDSEDLPLNVSREILQQNKMIESIRKSLVKKTIETFETLKEDPEKYKTFYDQFAKNIKLGICEDPKNKDKLSPLLMFHTNKADTQKTLDEYVENMQENQPGIYYITGENKQSVSISPFIEKLNKKGFEVLYFTDPLDEYLTQHLSTYKDKKLMCITRSDLDLGDTEDEKEKLKQLSEEYKGLCDNMKNVLGDTVEKVTVSNRVTDSPCCLVSSQFGWTANMERILKAQALQTNMEHASIMTKKTMEINTEHKIIKGLFERFKKTPETCKDIIYLLFESAVLDSGFTLQQPRDFTKRIHNIISVTLNPEDDDLEDDLDSNEEVFEDSTQEQVENGESKMEEID
ncbi:hypothetical protein CYMTET_46715 [Cymbomonas tetramitiformis]|uniref:Heat shock protein 90 n=1 Tax=Cymbomonas tetramitiformis TaxID=36881 RepID=A0AAE0BXF3_9CHLO|nr:hypothetical protein CYMTET_46715 [Cymbomonas tetramitiformis]